MAFFGFMACKRTGEVQKVETAAIVPRAAIMPRAETAKADAARAVGPVLAEHADRAEHKISVKKCDDICRIAEPLRCKNAAECKPRCQSMAALPVCKAEVASLFDCLIRQPIKNWECDEDGIGAIRDPLCGREQSGLASCVETNLQR
jgi:hypothetical protein